MKEAIQWEGMNSQMRILLLVSVFFNVCSFYVFCLLGSGACFETIVITTDYRGEPLHGDFLKFIKPFGWAGIALQGASWIVYQLFAVMLAAKATEIQNSGFVSALPTIGQPLESMALQTHAVAWGGQSNTAGRSIARASTLPAPAPMQVVCVCETCSVLLCLRAFACVCGGRRGRGRGVFAGAAPGRLYVLPSSCVRLRFHVLVPLPVHMPPPPRPWTRPMPTQTPRPPRRRCKDLCL